MKERNNLGAYKYYRFYLITWSCITIPFIVVILLIIIQYFNNIHHYKNNMKDIVITFSSFFGISLIPLFMSILHLLKFIKIKRNNEYEIDHCKIISIKKKVHRFPTRSGWCHEIYAVLLILETKEKFIYYFDNFGSYHKGIKTKWFDKLLFKEDFIASFKCYEDTNIISSTGTLNSYLKSLNKKAKNHYN